MYNEAIKNLLRKIEALPETVVLIYLIKAFGLNESQARKALFAACRNRDCYKVGNMILRNPYIKPDSRLLSKAKAFCVALEFLPDSQEFICATYPWDLTFICKGKMVQICHINRSSEYTESKIIADKPIPTSERSSIIRIVIVEPNANLDRLLCAGFTYYCEVDDSNFKVSIVGKRENNEEAWADVPEKA